MIDKNTNERIIDITFYNQEIENIRIQAMQGNQESLKDYENWFNTVISELPSVFHYSWKDIERKIKLYRDYWQNHWNDLWGKNSDDTAENNMMFDVPWSQVTDDMIKTRAVEIQNGTGGWIWHQKWQGQKLPHLTIIKSEPKIMKEL